MQALFAEAAPVTPWAESPFDLDHDRAYRRWREWKLDRRPRDAAALRVEVADARALAPAERAALRTRIAQGGCAIYRLATPGDDAARPRALAAQLGLTRLDANWLAADDGLSRIEVGERHDREGRGTEARGGESRGDFIPYTDRAIGWHTDGYYQSDARRIRGMLLHCVRPAREGGDNRVLDPELAYIALRDESPALVRALMQPDAMTIPARSDGEGIARAAQTGAVFSVVAADGGLHLRYTARKRSIEWKRDAATAAAVERLAALLDGPNPWVLALRLEAGEGLVGHNVLHARSAFADDPAAPRLLYRARYLDRVTGAEDDAWR